jgi:hypothetical protein
MPFGKSKNAHLSKRLTGISNTEGPELAEQLIRSGFEGVKQKEANSWLLKERLKRYGWKVVIGTITVLGSIATVVATSMSVFHK